MEFHIPKNTLDKILYLTAIGAIFLTALTPFVIVTHFFFPFITGKAIFFRILAEISFFSWAILAIRNPIYRPKISPIFYGILAFVISIGISDLLGPNVLKSLMSNMERMEGWVTLAHLLFFFITVASVINTEKLWRGLFESSLLASLAVCFYGGLQLLGKAEINQGGVRIDSTLGNASYLATYVLLHFFLAIFLFFYLRADGAMRIERKIFYVIAGLFNLFILFQTSTRGAFVGLVSGLFVFLALSVFFHRKNTRIRNIASGFLVGLLVLLSSFYLMKDSAFVQNYTPLARLASINLEQASPRLIIWNIALQGFKDRPIFGWGQENFNYVFNKYYDPRLYGQEPWFDRSHNIIFDILVTSGIVGFIFYLLIGFSLLSTIWKAESGNFFHNLWAKLSDKISFLKHSAHNLLVTEKIALTSILTAYFVSNMFVFDNVTSYIFIALVVAFLHHLTARPIKSKNLADNISSHLEVSLVSAMMIIFVFVSYFSIYKPALAAKNILYAIYPITSAKEKIVLIEKAISLKTAGRSEARERLADIALSIGSNEKESLEVRNAILSFARNEMERQIEETPNDARYRNIYGSFLSSVGLRSDAEKQYEKALELTPGKQLIMFEHGVNKIVLEKYDEALQIFKQAYELNENFYLAKLYFAMSAIYTKDDALTDEIIKTAFNNDIPAVPQIIKAYFDTGQKEKVLELTEKNYLANPDNLEARLVYAGALLQMNYRSRAIEEIQKIIDANPSFREQGEYYISEIKAGRNP